MFDIVQFRKGKRVHTNVTVDTNAQAVVAANNSRKSVIFQNQGDVTVFLGKLDVSQTGATRGYALFKGLSFTDDSSDEEWWAIAASGSAIVHIVEVT